MLYLEFERVYEFRNLLGMSLEKMQARIQEYVRDQLLPKMQAEFPDARIDIGSIASSPAMETAEQDAITALVRALTGDTAQRKMAYFSASVLRLSSAAPAILSRPTSPTSSWRCPNCSVAKTSCSSWDVHCKKPD